MLPMTPLQSWALIILLLGTVAITVWAFSSASPSADGESADEPELRDHDDSTDIAAADATQTVTGPFIGRPELRLMESAAAEPRERADSELYDWAEQGL